MLIIPSTFSCNKKKNEEDLKDSDWEKAHKAPFSTVGGQAVGVWKLFEHKNPKLSNNKQVWKLPFV